MPSPFPGMDPFLEKPASWGGFHSRLINSMSDNLADRISPSFHVDIEERVYITMPDDPHRHPIVPDVYVVSEPRRKYVAENASGIAAPTLIEAVYPEEIRDRCIEIRDANNREVITTIELLSPFNKAAESPGRQAFTQKREAVMKSKTHWIKIDLLRAGERPRERAGKSDYYVLLKRGASPGPF